MRKRFLIAAATFAFSTPALAKSCAEFLSLMRRDEAATDMQIRTDAPQAQVCEGRRLRVGTSKALETYPSSWIAKCGLVYPEGTYKIVNRPGSHEQALHNYKDLCHHGGIFDKKQ